MNHSRLCRFQLAHPEFRKLFHEKPWKGLDDECRELSLHPTHGLLAQARFRPLRAQVQRKLSYQTFLLLRSIPLHGLCSVNLPTQPSRYRNLFEFHQTQTLPPGLSWHDRSQHFGQSQSESRLAHLCRFRAHPYCSGTQTLCPRSLCGRVGSDRLCLRFGCRLSAAPCYAAFLAARALGAA